MTQIVWFKRDLRLQKACLEIFVPVELRQTGMVEPVPIVGPVFMRKTSLFGS
ncbi:MAG: hypothetical protein KGQ79_00680 [Proteobacteria bacterium]|nr:hypothetical protein [Pseudomonadota bacterium]MBU6424896.1 hypothetical protein [Rhodospirillales bacterium]